MAGIPTVSASFPHANKEHPLLNNASINDVQQAQAPATKKGRVVLKFGRLRPDPLQFHGLVGWYPVP